VPILEGNVKRVLTRLEGITEWPGQSRVEKQLWQISEELLPEPSSRLRDSSPSRLRDYTQAIMDLGATVCKRSSPDCERCPLTADCQAYIYNLTGQIPARKPKKAKPVHEKVFLVLRNPQGEVLLEKRPARGIWGGLWSFPEATADQLDSTLDKLQCHTCHQEWMPQGTHVFSHFQLNYHPLLITCKNNSGTPSVDETGQQIWYSDALESRIGLAAPVVGLLGKIRDLQNG